MKRTILSTIGIIGLALTINGSVYAQGMMGNTATAPEVQTAREEAEGKAVWEKLQAKQLNCSDLPTDNFEVLGEYFMGQMLAPNRSEASGAGTGTSHQAMNTMMEQMMGKAGEEQMHQVMGKRLSGCDTSAAFPSGGAGFMPMMQMMMGGSSPFGSNQLNNSMMNFGFAPLGWFGWIFMILWWVLVIAAIVALIKWLISQSGGVRDLGKTPLEILKARYAKGEIDKKEFEEKKKDLA